MKKLLDNRGGKREGSGRKPLFIDTKTITVRIPTQAEPEIREAIKTISNKFKSPG